MPKGVPPPGGTGEADQKAEESPEPLGFVPFFESLNLEGLDLTRDDGGDRDESL
jgi:hypothetical protein